MLLISVYLHHCQYTMTLLLFLLSTVNYPHPLHMAVAVGKHPGVIRNLVMMFGVDKCDEFGRTPLMFAALGNKVSYFAVWFSGKRHVCDARPLTN